MSYEQRGTNFENISNQKLATLMATTDIDQNTAWEKDKITIGDKYTTIEKFYIDALKSVMLETASRLGSIDKEVPKHEINNAPNDRLANLLPYIATGNRVFFGNEGKVIKRNDETYPIKLKYQEYLQGLLNEASKRVGKLKAKNLPIESSNTTPPSSGKQLQLF